MPKILLCPPTYYTVKYSINPWMQGEIVDKLEALNQWAALKDTLESLGITTHLMKPDKKLPDMVFTANGALVHGDVVVLSNFKPTERIDEYAHFRRWFLHNGYNAHTISPYLKFEGGGDAVIHGNRIIAGYGFRTELEALEKVADVFNLNLVPLKLKDPRFYHLDTCFSILDKINGLGIYYPDAFEANNVSVLTGLKLIKIPEGDAIKFACNSVAYNNTVIMPANNHWTANSLRKLNYTVIELDMSEYLKAGGAAKCLALWI